MEGTPHTSSQARIFTISSEKEHNSELTSDLLTAPTSIDREDQGLHSPASRSVDKAYIMFTLYESWSGHTTSLSAKPLASHRTLPARLSQGYRPLVDSTQMHALYARGFPLHSNHPMNHPNRNGRIATHQSPNLLHPSGHGQMESSLNDGMPRALDQDGELLGPSESSHGSSYDIDSGTGDTTNVDADLLQRAVQAAADAGQLAAEFVETPDTSKTHSPRKLASLRQTQPRASNMFKKSRSRIRLPPMGTFPPSPPARSPERNFKVPQITKAPRSDPATAGSIFITPPPRYVTRRSKRLSEAARNQSVHQQSSTSPAPIGGSITASLLSAGKRGKESLSIVGSGGKSSKNSFTPAHRGDMHAWLQETLLESQSVRTEEADDSGLLSSKAKMYTMLNAQEIRRILALADIDHRAQSFVEALTGTYIPLNQRFWSESKGKDVLRAVAQWRELVKIKELIFESGERLTVVEF